MQTVKEVASKLAGAKIFSVLDAGKAYYQVKVSEESSELLMFNTPFGRHKFKRKPFEIKMNINLQSGVAYRCFIKT